MVKDEEQPEPEMQQLRKSRDEEEAEIEEKESTTREDDTIVHSEEPNRPVTRDEEKIDTKEEKYNKDGPTTRS